MAQQFSRDVQGVTATINVPSATETNAATTNPLSPPYGVCKAVIIGIMEITCGGSNTNYQLRVRRDINGANVIVGTSGIITLLAGATATLAAMFQEQVPAGVNPQYTLSVVPNASGVASTILLGSGIDVTLISG